jgi:malonate-semialdehyde dehydrogenase (acetylating)/methylmalonate-semialdehyde dehydrogenase
MTEATATHTKVRNYIDGKWMESKSAEWKEVINPATGETIALTPLSPASEVDAAVEAAFLAYREWRRTPAEDRIQPLFKLKMLLEDHVDDLGRIISQENGKTFAEGKAELRRAIENVEVACGIPTMMQGYNLEDVARGVDEMMIRQPLGVVAAIKFSGHDSLLVSALRDRHRKYFRAETVRARPAHHDARIRASRADRLAQRRSHSDQRR